MAQQLHKAGEEVAFGGLIDSPNPAHPPVRMSLSERTKRRLEIASHLSPLDQLRYFAGRALPRLFLGPEDLIPEACLPCTPDREILGAPE
jgi:hypothetical protein